MRKRVEGRLQVIAAAAREAFTRRGYALTQMADAARLAGVSAGTLYLYAGSKEALFELALRDALDLLPDDATLPLRAIGEAKTLKMLAAAVAIRDGWPVLKRALGAPAPADPAAEIAAVFGEFFDGATRQRKLIWLLDACAWDVPVLAGAFAKEIRAPYFADVTGYVARRRRQGVFASGGTAAAVARGIVEAGVWLALDRPRDPMPTGIADAEAREALVTIATGALLGPTAGPRPSPRRRKSAGRARPP